MTKVCEFCRFWRAWPDRDQRDSDVTFGDCRKHSPVLFVDPEGRNRPRTKWPSTRHDDFCGSFKLDQQTGGEE